MHFRFNSMKAAYALEEQINKLFEAGEIGVLAATTFQHGQWVVVTDTSVLKVAHKLVRFLRPQDVDIDRTPKGVK